MSDGREEREELKVRIEQLKKANPEDFPGEDLEEWEPERVDS